MKIVEKYMDGQTDLIEINSAVYIGDYAIPKIGMKILAD